MTTVHEQHQKCLRKLILRGVLACLGGLFFAALVAGAVSFSTTVTSPKTSEHVENQRSRAFVFRSAHAWSTVHPRERSSSGKKKIEGRLQRPEFEIGYALASARGQLGGLSSDDVFHG